MDVHVEKTGSYLCKLSVSIPAIDVDSAFDKALRKVGKDAQIHGFRPGKVPRSIIERQFAPQIEQEVQNQLVESSLYQAIENEKLAPVAAPRVQLGNLHRGAHFSYTAELEIRPEIALQKYVGLVAPAAHVKIAAEQIDQHIEGLRKEAAELVPVLLRDVVQNNDVVQIDYEGSIDGVPFDGGKADNALVEVGGKGYIPGFAEGLLGAKVPSERAIELTFPEDYSAERLAGQHATFHVHLKELKAHQLPSLDDEFAKDMGASSLGTLRAKVEVELTVNAQQEFEQQRRDILLKALVEANPFEVPPSMIHDQTNRIVATAAARVEQMTQQRVALNDAQIANLMDTSRQEAEFQVRSGLLMLEVAKAESLAVAPEEVENEVEAMARSAGTRADQLRSFYDEAKHRDELRFRLLEEKVVALLAARSTASAETAAETAAETEPETETATTTTAAETEPPGVP